MSYPVDCPYTGHHFFLHTEWDYCVLYQCDGCGVFRTEAS